MTSLNWTPLRRKYQLERTKSKLARDETNIHPLLPNKQRILILNSNSKDAATNAGKETISDPLSMLAMKDPLSAMLDDPLSVIDDPLRSPAFMSNQKPSGHIYTTGKSAITEEGDEKDTNSLASQWNLKKLQIAKDYAMTGSIMFQSSAIEDFDGSGVEDGSNTRKVMDKYTQRLANLEKKEESTVSMTQKEYEEHINKLHISLNQAWANDERVGSLKIAIQLAKMLADTSVPKFYPCMYVMVTDILEKFGDMVFNRLKNKSEEALSEGLVGNKKAQLLSTFKASDIPVSAKETCRNWFYKTACIRELLPRIYIEITLFKCYRFLTDSDFPAILSRLASIIRGIGDPLVSFYCRTFLIVTGNKVCPEISQYTINMAQDMMISYQIFREPYYNELLSKRHVTHIEYMLSLSPAVEWLIKVIANKATKETFQSILYLYREHSNDAMLLKHIMDHFNPEYYSHATLGLIALIKSSDISCCNTVDLFTSLGKQLLAVPPPEDQRLAILNDVWKVVTKCEDIGLYVKCTFSWLDTVQKHYSERETMILLADLSSRLQGYQDELPESVMRHLESIVMSMVTQSTTLGQAVLTSEHLLKILDAFKGTKKVNICKEILEAFRKHPSTSDAILINTLFDITRVLHDSVDHLSPYSDIKYISNLIIYGFIYKIDFGKDLESQLNIYVECRSIFCNLDLVLYHLVMSVSHLAIKALKYVKGHHNKKTAAFVKGCLAYCHITTPSIMDTSSKLALLLHCAEIALLNNCLPQTDAFLKACISLIPEYSSSTGGMGASNDSSQDTIVSTSLVKTSTEENLYLFINKLLSFLVLVPGHPEYGPFYIIHGLVNAIPRYPWPNMTAERGNNAIMTTAMIRALEFKTKIYIDILGLLTALAQSEIPYKIDGVDSNDTLYGSNSTYLSELGQLTNTCMEEIIQQLTVYTSQEKVDNNSKVTQARLIMQFSMRIAATIAFNLDVSRFIVKLLDLVQKQTAIMTKTDLNVYKNCKAFLISKANASEHVEATQALISYLQSLPA